MYCAITVTGTNYNKTWLNLNLGAEYANINSSHFDPTVSKTGTDAHNEAKTYGSYYQWQRASDGHEFRGSETTPKLADTWTDTGEAAGKFIINDNGWVKNNPLLPDNLWQAGEVGVNNPCPSGYHVPTEQEWQEFHQVVTGDAYVETDQMWTQNKLPNLVVAGTRFFGSGSLGEENDEGIYWSSSGRGIAQYMYFRRDRSGTSASNIVNAFNVRCIKDNN
ncbi:fibrobacter succinogenes major paralogous domain [Candidatus Ornithobacterium hominis]|nr:fibrobacter succinogenes major paralogous domain [Candidatus Ornithobacterium hominis]